MKKFKKFDRGQDQRRGRDTGKGGGRSRDAHGRGPQSQQRENSTPPGRCVVGIHAVNELLKIRAKAIDQLWVRDRYADHADLKEIFETAKRSGLRVQTQAPSALDKIVGNNQGVLAFTQWQPQIDWPALEKAERATLIALDEVEDPHNLGAVMRTAWLFGAQGVLVPEHRSANLSPAVSKVAQGAVEHIPLEQETNLPQQLETLKKNGFWVLGLSHKATQSLYQLDIPKKVIWVLGSESSGLRKSVEGACDDLISIPQADPDASYNVSVAAAVALAESFRQSQKG